MAANADLSVWVEVDASVKHDSTGIVAATWDRAAKRVRMVYHRIFPPSPRDPINFESDVEATILDLKHRFRLREVRFDPYQTQASAQRLRQAGINMVEFPQSMPNLTSASQNLFELIKAQNLVAYPDADLRLAVQRSWYSNSARADVELAGYLFAGELPDNFNQDQTLCGVKMRLATPVGQWLPRPRTSALGQRSARRL